MAALSLGGWHGAAWPGRAWPGKARRGEARHGAARRGMAWGRMANGRDKGKEYRRTAGPGVAGPGKARRGLAGQGMAWGRMANSRSSDVNFPHIVHNRRMGPYTYDLWIVDQTAAEWYSGSENHNTQEFDWCLAHIKPGMVVLDCGAFHGATTVVFSKAVGEKGKVGAFEALPRNAAVIRRNLVLNKCVNATVYPNALGDTRGSVVLDANHSNAIVQWNADPAESADLAYVIPLDHWAAHASVTVDFLKIDVEGSELQMLRGARSVLAERPIIDLELHNFLFADRRAVLEEMFAILQPLEYVYALLRVPHEGYVEALGWRVDLAELARWDNPHIFCLPVWAG
jgi:FkbM family methyltransferase